METFFSLHVKDIKPSNLLIDIHCNMKLCDFGLCRSVKEGWSLTDYVATRHYRAPEVLLGSKAYTQRLRREMMHVDTGRYKFSIPNEPI